MKNTKDIAIPDSVADGGATAVVIFRALFTHEFMSVETIADRTEKTVKGISPYLTHLRRTGWIEYKGTKGHRLWKRRVQWAEPQADFYSKRKPSNARHDAEWHLTQAAHHINEALKQVETIRQIQKLAAKLPPAEDS